MKGYLYILIIIVLFSCNQHKKAEITKIEAITDDSEAFLSLFPEIMDQELHVYTPFEGRQGDLFEGKVIDSTFYKYFTFEEYYIPQNNYYRLYSCYKIKLNDNETGLIVRSPSQYSETAVDLLIWDNQNKRIKRKESLADSFGDEGWYFVKDAWLKDLNKDKYVDIIIRKMEYDIDLDDTIKAPIIKDSLFVYLGNKTCFTKTSYQVDTNKYIVLGWDK